jgi:hypothetical protein
MSKPKITETDRGFVDGASGRTHPRHAGAAYLEGFARGQAAKSARPRPRRQRCPVCEGRRILFSSGAACPECSGTGKVPA